MVAPAATHDTRRPCRRCGRPSASRGLCWSHYRSERPNRVPAAPLREQLRTIKEATGASITGLADASGVPRSTIAAILSGERATVTQATAAAILTGFPTSGSITIDGPLVPVLGTRRRLRALRAAGITSAAIVEAAGIHPATIDRYTWDRTDCPDLIAASHASAIKDLFARWGAMPVARPPLYVAQQQWPLPVEWDDDQIDDPDGRHHAHGHTRAWRLREYLAGNWPAPLKPATRLAAEYAARGELEPSYARRYHRETA